MIKPLEIIKPIHPFPARMAPSIVREFLSNKGRPLNILDPMAGSGTTLVTALTNGHNAFGCDTDPLSVLISQIWCSNIDAEGTLYRAKLVLDRAKNISDSIQENEAYPSKADNETRNFIDFWFDENNRIQLYALSKSISRVRKHQERAVLWCAFSRLIITKKVGASLAMDVSHSRPHRVYRY
jgi:tRNA G10  N-methylase Trm11